MAGLDIVTVSASMTVARRVRGINVPETLSPTSAAVKLADVSMTSPHRPLVQVPLAWIVTVAPCGLFVTAELVNASVKA